MQFRILGPLEVLSPAPVRPGTGKSARVLAALLLRPNTWVSVERLVQSAWPGQAPPASARANLKTYVWQLRRLTAADGGERIERGAGAYRIRVEPGELDADRAAELALAARAAADDRAALALVRDALRLWRGRPLDGLDVDGAVLDQLEDLHHGLREQLGERQLAVGCATDAAATLRALTADAPLRESAWTVLIRALHAAGMRAEAATAYRSAVEVLAGELGVRPGRALTEAHRLAVGDVRRELPSNPRLTGRDTELDVLCRAAPVVLVDGMPGAGKTALVVHAAHRLAPAFPDGQLFVTLGGRVPAAHRLLRGVGVRDIPADPDEQTALWRSEVARRRLLIVLDGARDAEQVRPLLPAAPGSRTLITTAHRGWHLDGATRVRLGLLDDDAAARLFASAAGISAAGTSAAGPQRTDRCATAAVLRGCGGLPAALLDAAARLVTRPHWSLRRLADELAEDPCRVFTGAVRQSLGAVVGELDRAEQDVWRALGDLPAEFAPPGGSRAACESLVDRGLLDSAGPDRYRSHVVIRHLAACRPARTGRRAA